MAIEMIAHLVETEQFSKTTQAQILGGSQSLASEALTGEALRTSQRQDRNHSEKEEEGQKVTLVSKMAGRSLPTYLWQLAYAHTRI